MSNNILARNIKDRTFIGKVQEIIIELAGGPGMAVFDYRHRRGVGRDFFIHPANIFVNNLPLTPLIPYFQAELKNRGIDVVDGAVIDAILMLSIGVNHASS
jgi:hypothetical protein